MEGRPDRRSTVRAERKTMATSFGALCSDFYVNQRLSLKMDLPGKRETVLDLFERIRRFRNQMDRFRRFDGELSLESPPVDGAYDWLSMRRTNIRSGSVNPTDLEWAYSLHRTILEVAPYYLSISPIEVDYVELMFGFDLEANGNHDEIVYDALLADTAIGGLIDTENESPSDVQPFIGFTLEEDDEKTIVNFEIKTRTLTRPISDEKFDDEPISIFLSVRRNGPIEKVDDLKTIFNSLTRQAERLATDKLLPHMLNPITRAISSRSC